LEEAWQQQLMPSTLILILPANMQREIQRRVAETFRLRKQSKHLLECARRAVEIAIEQDDEAAMAWLEDQTAAV